MVAGGGGSFAPLADATRPPTDDSWVVDGVVADGGGEPTVLFEGGTSWTMFSAGGSVGAEAMGRWTSTNGDDWTEYGDVLGQGIGVSGVVVRAAVTKFDGTYWAFYVDVSGTTGNLKAATSADGITWTGQGTVIANNAIAGATGWANSTVWQEGSTYYLLVEGNQNGGTSTWQVWLFTSTDLLSWTVQNSGNPLSSMRQVANGSVGGPTVAVLEDEPMPQWDGLYHVWVHCSTDTVDYLPTPTFHLTSTDRINWTTTSPNPVLTGLPQGAWDQTSDPFVHVANGVARIFYGGVNNGPFDDAAVAMAKANATY